MIINQARTWPDYSIYRMIYCLAFFFFFFTRSQSSVFWLKGVWTYFCKVTSKTVIRVLTGVRCVGGMWIVKRRGHTHVPSSWSPHNALPIILSRIFAHSNLKYSRFCRECLKIIANLSCYWPLETILSSWSVNSQMVKEEKRNNRASLGFCSHTYSLPPLTLKGTWHILPCWAFHFQVSIFPLTQFVKFQNG